MAASIQTNDFVHKTVELVDSVQQLEITFDVSAISGFERNFQNTNIHDYFTTIGSQHPPDIVILQIGDNVNIDSALTYKFGDAYGAVLDELLDRWPNARCVAVSKWWPNAIDTMIARASNRSRVMRADVQPLTQDTLNFAYTEHAFCNADVGRHPGDRGMWAIARLLVNVISPTSGVDASVPPSCYALDECYPNPFNPRTTIRYRLPLESKVLLVVRDGLGREVTTLVDARQMPGEHTAVFDGSGLASGVYYVQMKTGYSVLTKRILLVK
jgi:hypothetical protein